MTDHRVFTNPPGGNCWVWTSYEKLEVGSVFQLMDEDNNFVPNEEGGRHFVATALPYREDGKWWVFGRPASDFEIAQSEAQDTHAGVKLT